MTIEILKNHIEREINRTKEDMRESADPKEYYYTDGEYDTYVEILEMLEKIDPVYTQAEIDSWNGMGK